MRSGGPFVVSLRRSRDESSMAALVRCDGGVVGVLVVVSLPPLCAERVVVVVSSMDAVGIDS